ncbi:Disease resistance protein [Citrus sinensis]|uniref:Disease resistance protein n=1 Tax=Citrus sinensis TaxID=2711 RepID=A0ACB8KKQ6_CITSI|nr:Disease resistance protein [Citrus sinensis]
MVEIIINVVFEVAKWLAAPMAAPIGRQVSYLSKSNYTSSFENLKKEVEKLRGERESMGHRVDEAERNSQEIEKNVEKWLERVNKIIDETVKLTGYEETATKHCFKGLCPNLKTRYQLSKKAATLVKDIVELREEASKFPKVSYRTIPEDIWFHSIKGYEAFESRSSTLKSIRNALTDPNVSIIGVYGMGGIGKTTLVKEVARRAKEDNIFDAVVFSEVSQTPNIKNIQGEIAEKLGLTLREESESRRASSLYERLKKEKKILVVLDNLWKSLDLETTIGIPYGDDHKGCKVLLTTRDRSVLLSMGSKENFPIGVLNEQEAWRLFKLTADDDVENRRLKSIATQVAKACGGLPIALTTIAKALRKKSVPEWENALQELRMPSMESFQGVPKEAYSTIELSYKYLEGEKLKKMFLLCSLMPNPCYTLDLLKYCMGLGMFQRVHKLEDAHKKLHAWVHELVDSCLLLVDDSGDNFSMHDVVRDVAISIACRDEHAFLVRNEDVWDWPDEDEKKECYAISVRDSSIHELPEGLKCPQLQFLTIANSKDSFLEIDVPQDFFTGMRKLRVVHFSGMRLASLPYSIGLLQNLQTLCLESSTFGDIAIIGKLKNLEVLSFVQSDIVMLPKEIGQLTKLRLLDLTDCFKLKVIATNVLSSLTRLEALYMHNCYVEWEVETRGSEKRSASLDEFLHLPRLTTLEIEVRNDDILPEGFFTKKLARFKISIGDGSFSPPFYIVQSWFRSRPNFMIGKHESLRTLKLKLSSKPIGSKELQGVNNVEYLCLDELPGVKTVLFELDTRGFSQLKHLHIQNNRDLLCVVDSTDRVTYDAFPLLESLTLHNLIRLERTCMDRLKVESFNELKTIKVENCDELTNIFWLSNTKCLPKLERIAVIDCKMMEEVFAIGGEADVGNKNAIEKIEYAQLKSLSLGMLPKVTNFCREVKTPPASPNRRESEEDELDTSIQLFNEKVVLPNLEALELRDINIDRIWHYNELPAMFPGSQSLTRLILWDCNKLKYIFSASMIRSFEQLQSLEIVNCKVLQEIISRDRAEADQETTPCFVFPRLTTLVLLGLPELRCFYPGMHTSEWPALKELEVRSCGKIKPFSSELSLNKENDQLGIPAAQVPLFSFEKIFPNLEDLSLSGEDVKMILMGDFPHHLFGCLKQVAVVTDDSECFPLGLLERFSNMENLDLCACSYKEIFSSNDEYLEKDVQHFALIKRLELVNLDDLKHLWKPNSKLEHILQYLEKLFVSYCQSLLILLPSASTSFRNLTQLQVANCEKLINLVTSSVAKSLVGLQNLSILGCRAMTEAVTDDENGAANPKEEIVFTKLKSIILVDLDSLTSFCSANYTFNFPSLQDLEVIGCPKMTIFTTGELCTPPRVNVWYGEGNLWRSDDGGVNTTIQHLHDEKESKLLVVAHELKFHVWVGVLLLNGSSKQSLRTNIVDARFRFSSFYDQALCSINFTTTRRSPRKASSPEVPAHTDKSEYAGCFPGANPPTLKSDMKEIGLADDVLPGDFLVEVTNNIMVEEFLQRLGVCSPSLGRADPSTLGFWSRHKQALRLDPGTLGFWSRHKTGFETWIGILLAFSWSSRSWHAWLLSRHKTGFETLVSLCMPLILQGLGFCSPSRGRADPGTLGFCLAIKQALRLDEPLHAFNSSMLGILLAFSWSSRSWHAWLLSRHKTGFETLVSLCMPLILQGLGFCSPSRGRADPGTLGFCLAIKQALRLW